MSLMLCVNPVCGHEWEDCLSKNCDWCGSEGKVIRKGPEYDMGLVIKCALKVMHTFRRKKAINGKTD